MLVAQSERVMARFAPEREPLISDGLAVTHTRTRVVCETHCGRWNTESQPEWWPRADGLWQRQRLFSSRLRQLALGVYRANLRDPALQVLLGFLGSVGHLLAENDVGLE